MMNKKAYSQKKRYTLECMDCDATFKGRKNTLRCANYREIARQENNKKNNLKRKQLPKPPLYCNCGSGLALQKQKKVCTICLMAEKSCLYCGSAFKMHRRHKEKTAFCSVKCVRLYYSKQNVTSMAARIQELETKLSSSNAIIRTQQKMLDESHARCEELQHQVRFIQYFIQKEDKND